MGNGTVLIYCPIITAMSGRTRGGREGREEKKRLGDRERSITEANGDREERD